MNPASSISGYDACGRVPAMVRLGVRDSVHPNVKRLHIDILAEKLSAKGGTSLEALAGAISRPVNAWQHLSCCRLSCTAASSGQAQ